MSGCHMGQDKCGEDTRMPTLCLRRSKPEQKLLSKWVSCGQVVSLGRTVVCGILRPTVCSDTNRQQLSVWVAPLEMSRMYKKIFLSTKEKSKQMM
jgi:hypothetical protein